MTYFCTLTIVYFEYDVFEQNYYRSIQKNINAGGGGGGGV